LPLELANVACKCEPFAAIVPASVTISAHKGMNVSEQELIAAIDDILAAMTKNGYDQAEKNDVVAILYSLKGDVVRL